MNRTKIVGLTAIIALSIIALSIFASAFILPPVVSIGASPNPAFTTSTITAIGVDLSGSGLSSVRIYENGNLVKQCSTSTCVFVAVHTTPGARSYYASVSDNVGGSANSNTITVNFQNSAPILNYIGNKSVSASSTLRFTISGYDYNNDTLTYSAASCSEIGLPAGITFDSASGVFVWTPSAVQAGVHYINFSVSDGSLRDSEVVAITVTELSIPTYSSFNVNPNSPATYAPGQNYTFSSTWSDNGVISSVWIEFNGVNYSASQVSGTFSASGFSGVYNFVISDLRPGTYNYIWYARDASGNLNKSVSMNYVVGKATPALSLSLLPSNSVASNTSTNVTGLGCPVQLVCKLYRNGTEVNNSDVARLADGVHNYVYNTTGNENYTSASVSASLYVNSVSTGGGDSDENDDDSSDGRIRTVRDSDMLNGYYVYMNLDDRLKFNLCGMPYYLKLIEIDGSDDEAYFKFTPGTTSFVLGEGDKAEFDLSLNGVNDILFRVEKVESSRVKVYIKRMSDSCGSSAAAPLLIAGGEDFAEKLSFEGSASVLTYTTVSLMTGIFLATLAILISLLSRRRKR